MSTELKYRLVCREDYGRAVYPCVFDGSEGAKDCDWPLHVIVSKQPTISQSDDELLVTNFTVGDRDVRSIRSSVDPLHTQTKRKVYFKQHGFCIQNNPFDLPMSVDPNAETLNKCKQYECWVSKVDAADDALVAGMQKTHPRIWGMIHDRLDDYFDWGRDITHREQAVKYLKYNPNVNESAIYPPFLISILEDGHNTRSRIPLLPKDPIWDEKRPSPTEIRDCNSISSTPYDYWLDDDDIASDRACFWDALAISVPNTPFNTHVWEPLRILEIGCGMAVGAVPLVEYFKELRKFRSYLAIRDIGVLYTGVDINENSIKKARNTNPSEFAFFAEDARNFLGKLPREEYDVILFRHPGPIEISDDTGPEESMMWAGIMRSAYKHLDPDGIIIVSTYLGYEHLFALDIFQNDIGAKVYVAGQNPYSHRRDPYLLIAGKPR